MWWSNARTVSDTFVIIRSRCYMFCSASPVLQWRGGLSYCCRLLLVQLHYRDCSLSTVVREVRTHMKKLSTAL